MAALLRLLVRATVIMAIAILALLVLGVAQEGGAAPRVELPLEERGPHGHTLEFRAKGDYYRYLAEFSSETEKKSAADQSLMAYQHAMVVASTELSPAHPIRLGLALNFSVFFYEIMNCHERSFTLKASQVAKQAFDEATNEINSAGVEGYNDSILMMELLKDNLELWTSEPNEDRIAAEVLHICHTSRFSVQAIKCQL
ncbi:hypothetical protein ACQ4PT_028056 [Festuca glaucescens]